MRHASSSCIKVSTGLREASTAPLCEDAAVSASIPPWNPLSDALRADPRRSYDRQRAACPLARSAGGVTLFRHADVVATAMDPETFSSAASMHRQVPNSLDPPEHTAWRAVIDPFFTAARMQALERRLEAVARDAVAVLPRGVPVDAVTGFGFPYAVRAQVEWLGWHGLEKDLLAWMNENRAAVRSADRTRTAAVATAFDALVATQSGRRRTLDKAAPQDPTTELLQAVVDGQRLSDTDVVSILRNWTAGDLGSIAAALGVAVHFLATHPEVQTTLRAHPEELPAAIDEMLRIDDPFLANRRVSTRAARVAGFAIEPGTRLYLNWTSANRDEAVFGDPDAYRPRENAPRNLVYGIGIHACPGRPLATLELVVAVRTLLRSTTRVTFAPDAEPVRETYPLGGWSRLPVRLG